MSNRPPFQSLLTHITPKRALRFWSKIDRRGQDECWPWKPCHATDTGYGLIGFEGKGYRVSLLAHRLAYAMVNGEPPNDMLVCHSCDNPRCCNPRHLFLGTHQDNTDDMIAKGRAPSVAPNAGKRGVDHPRGRKRAHLRSEAIRLRAGESLSYDVIAQRLGIHRQTVMRWWYEHVGSTRINPKTRTTLAPR